MTYPSKADYRCDCGDYCEWCHPEMCVPVTCALCGGPMNYLGTLGKLFWFRCRNCGCESHRKKENL